MTAWYLRPKTWFITFAIDAFVWFAFLVLVVDQYERGETQPGYIGPVLTLISLLGVMTALIGVGLWFRYRAQQQSQIRIPHPHDETHKTPPTEL